MKKELDYNSAERLWKMFFRHFDRAHGIALVQDLWKIIPLIAVAIAVAGLSGCVTRDKQVHEKSTVFGFQAVSPGTSGGQIKIQIGLVRNDYFSNPTSTNQLYAKDWSSHVNAHLSAISQSAEEDYSTYPQSVTFTNGAAVTTKP